VTKEAGSLPGRKRRKLLLVVYAFSAAKKMPIASPRYALTQTTVAGAPADPGVYALWENQELIYYGRARGESATIQSCLRQHLARGNHCTARATHYAWEISANPSAREAELLREFEGMHKRRPRCNRG
jgi:hypothetical protein